MEAAVCDNSDVEKFLSHKIVEKFRIGYELLTSETNRLSSFS